MHKIFLGLGSNIGDKIGNIKKAIFFLKKHIIDIQVAPFYVSKAVGYENQEDFINTVLKGYTVLTPLELLDFTKTVEREVGRIYRFHWGPREIDIDILFFDDLVIDMESIKIPHPKLHERDFVLVPLKDLDENFIHPIFNKTIKELTKNLKMKSIIDKLD